MIIEPLSFDSMGTRSMCTCVETEDTRVIIDPGVSLAPKRYGLPPHEIEKEKMRKDWNRIVERSREADVLIVTHYHYDHYNPACPQIYEGKTVFVKDPNNNINYSQRSRASSFLGGIEKKAADIKTMDGKERAFGKTIVRFSQPVPHGIDERLGYVVEACISDGHEKFLYTSDVEGLCEKEQRSFILENKPDVLFIDGPLTYMLGYAFSEVDLKSSIDAIVEVLDRCDIKKMVIDHHLVRDPEWKVRIKEVLERGAEKGTQVMTAAEFAGKENLLLEARRRELYQKG